ncbi:MAG: ABC transporter permease subunit [Chloroflexi bacterium]|nr:ABC transporter permease subunit [Chloroflexota bacterium]
MRRWNGRAIRAVMRKDLQQVRQNRMVWLPMILVPAIFNVLLPLMMTLLPTLSPGDFTSGSGDIAEILAILPASWHKALGGLSPAQQWVYVSINVLFAPMFLIVPMMVSSILAADSIAGERERKTLEGLLYTPMTDTEIFVAKVLYSFVPACIVSVASFILYGLVANVAGYRTMGRLFFPTATWWPLVFWLAPGVSAMGLGATVLISSKAKTFMQAQQMAGMLVLPIVFLMIGQVTGLFFLGVGVILAIGALAWLVGIWLIWVGARTFERGELIARV